jgi:integrase
LTRLCDYHDAPVLLDARDIIRGILRLLQHNADLSRNDYRSLAAVPDAIDDAYRSLPITRPVEEWWRETLREALLSQLLLSPNPITVDLLAKALRNRLPISFALHQRQHAPLVRILLVRDCLQIAGNEYARLAIALTDTAKLLESLPPLRKETLHSENATALAELRKAQKLLAAIPSPRERLSRLARDIGVAALAQRREYHAPTEQRLPLLEIRHELIQRSNRWNEPERTALNAALLLGRLGAHILKTENLDPHCHIEHDHLHETWIYRRLPDAPEFSRQLDGLGYENVGRQLHLPVPRRLGDAIKMLVLAGQGSHALRNLEKKLRELSRDSGQPITLRRLTRIFEYALENETPDEALVTLLGLQPQAHRDAGIHYYAPNINELIKRVQNVIEQTVSILDLDVLNDGWSSPPPPPTPYLGYSFRADVGAVHRLIKALQSSAELGRGRATPQRVVDAYNARVARLTLMYLAGTGARPTGTVLPSKGDVSFTDRAAITSEKDAIGYRSTRLVPLPSQFITEVTDFECWASNKRLLPHKPTNDDPFLMLRAVDGRFLAPTITALKETVAGFGENWVWPDDMLRHLFRSRLWDMGCPSSWLRRVMGHHPPHGATDMPWHSQPQWHGLHDWSDQINEHLNALGF